MRQRERVLTAFAAWRSVARAGRSQRAERRAQRQLQHGGVTHVCRAFLRRAASGRALAAGTALRRWRGVLLAHRVYKGVVSAALGAQVRGAPSQLHGRGNKHAH